MRLGVASASACLLVLGAAAFGCGEESEGVFDEEAFPFTFEYPSDFEESGDPTVGQQLGVDADETAAIGLDDDNGILVQTFTLQAEVDESNLDEAKQEIDALVRQVTPGVSSTTDTVAGLPALTVSELPIPSIEDGQSRLVIVFDGDQQYFLNCQSTTERAAIEEACDQAVETFSLK